MQLSGKVLMHWVVCVKKPWDGYPGFLDPSLPEEAYRAASDFPGWTLIED